MTCAAPAYLDRVGVPDTVDELTQHQCLIGSAATWHFVERGTARNVTPRGRWRCNSGAAIVEAALSGMGICQLPEFYVKNHVKARQLMPVLTHARSAPETIWAVYPKRRQLQPKIRHLVDLLEDELPRALDHPTMRSISAT